MAELSSAVALLEMGTAVARVRGPLGNGSSIPRRKLIRELALVLVVALSLFLRCTRRPRLRRRANNLRRQSTRPNLFIDLNGRNRDSQVKGLCWLQSIKRPARLPERECCRAPETNNSMALLLKLIHSSVSSRAQARRSRFQSSLRLGPNLRRRNKKWRSRRFFIRY